MARTVTEARALPELVKPDSRFADRQTRAKELCLRRPDGRVAVFLDEDGRVMKVVDDGKGEAKVMLQPFADWGN